MVQRSDMVKVLRDLADNLEGADMPVQITVFEYNEKVTNPEMGGAIVDVKWHGRTIVIHVGDSERVNHITLAERLPSANIDAA